jgi:hypothetical protein
VLKDGSNVVVHLAPSPVVVRIATFTARIRRDPVPWLEREVALVTATAAAGGPVMTASALVAPGPHRSNGWWLTAWAFIEHEEGGVPDAGATLAVLDRLHASFAAVRDLPELPLLGPVTEDFDLAVRFATETGVVSTDRAAWLVETRDAALTDVLAETDDRGALHGDAFPRNSLVTASGPVWIDLEDCCRGPRVWDDATLLLRTADPALERTLVRRHGRSALTAATALRRVQEEIWTLLHDARRDGRLPPIG